MKTWELLGNMYVSGHEEEPLIIPITSKLLIGYDENKMFIIRGELNFKFLPENSLRWEDHWLEIGYTKI